MGFRFRKSISTGPFRINLSKSGVGWSVGGKGLRYGQRAGGRSYTTFSVPGTGVSYTTGGSRSRGRSPGKSGCLIPIIAFAGLSSAAVVLKELF